MPDQSMNEMSFSVPPERMITKTLPAFTFFLSDNNPFGLAVRETAMSAEFKR